MLWFGGSPDSHVMIVTYELSGKLEGGRCGWVSPTTYLSCPSSRAPAPPLDLRAPPHPRPHPEVETLSSFAVPSCPEDRFSLILIPILAISPPASFQPMALRDGYYVCIINQMPGMCCWKPRWAFWLVT